jgi:hypothetical protein
MESNMLLELVSYKFYDIHVHGIEYVHAIYWYILLFPFFT